MLHSSGDKYTGNWIDGKFTGFGVLDGLNGFQRVGTFVDGLLFGLGYATDRDGSK